MPDLQRNKETTTAYCDVAFIPLHPRAAVERCAGGAYIRRVLRIAPQNSANPNGML
ncbi:hypothetical protein [Methyloceanibacter sp.]|uniref:hypothetical protein n=1 Tax=Methyloceanibacter sp. TaxID=1965321 RepID=UPI002C4A6F91|nr:hypothetical protein [Methyloceanibacter sp.]HML93521.1 hypothetical protein [Methyloceanibacter sp.]